MDLRMCDNLHVRELMGQSKKTSRDVGETVMSNP